MDFSEALYTWHLKTRACQPVSGCFCVVPSSEHLVCCARYRLLVQLKPYFGEHIDE